MQVPPILNCLPTPMINLASITYLHVCLLHYTVTCHLTSPWQSNLSVHPCGGRHEGIPKGWFHMYAWRTVFVCKRYTVLVNTGHIYTMKRCKYTHMYWFTVVEAVMYTWTLEMADMKTFPQFIECVEQRTIHILCEVEYIAAWYSPFGIRSASHCRQYHCHGFICSSWSPCTWSRSNWAVICLRNHCLAAEITNSCCISNRGGH